MTFRLSLKPGLADLTPAEAAEGWIELQEKYPNKVLTEQNFFIANTQSFSTHEKVYPVLRSETMSCPDQHMFKTLVSPACSGINTDWMDEFMQVRVSFVCLFFKNWRRYVRSWAAASTILPPTLTQEVGNSCEIFSF